MEDPTLRFRKLWIGIGYVGICLLVYLSLTPMPHHVLKFSIENFSAGDKIEHILGFMAPMLWFGQIYWAKTKRLGIGIALAVIAIVLEYGQRAIGGYPNLEYGDIVASIIGIALGGILLKTRLAFLLKTLESWW